MSTRFRNVFVIAALALVACVLLWSLRSSPTDAPAVELRKRASPASDEPLRPALELVAVEAPTIPDALANAPMELMPITAQDGPSDVIVGSVRLDGQPLAEATVDVRGLSPDGALVTFESIQTAPDGTFLARRPDELTAELIARFASLDTARLVVPAALALDAPVRLNLHSPWRVSGVVMDADGRRLAAGRVRLWLEPRVLPKGTVESLTASADISADGSFVIHVPRSGACRLIAYAPSFPSSTMVEVVVSDDWPSATASLIMPRAASAHGRLFAADGHAIGGVVIYVWPVLATDGLDWPPASDRFGTTQATTRDDGCFELSALVPSARYRASGGVCIDGQLFSCGATFAPGGEELELRLVRVETPPEEDPLSALLRQESGIGF